MNLTRVNDILSELRKQIGPLERQSQTARVFEEKRSSENIGYQYVPSGDRTD